jgi:hypothetical protein
MNDLLAHFLRTVHREYFMGFPLWCTADGRIAGEFFKIRLESRFRPVLGEQGAPLGLVAELLAIGPGGDSIGEQALARLTRVSESPVVLDRFIRCLHLLNFLRKPPGKGRLLLPVSAALLERVEGEHGKVFRQILDRLELPPQVVGFLLPGSLASAPATLAQLRQNYARQGIEVYLPLAERDDGCLWVRSLEGQSSLGHSLQRKRA